MSGCGNPQYERLLHAYELGMLSEAERDELEIHLLECEACFAETQQLEEAAELLRHDDEVLTTVERIVTEHGSGLDRGPMVLTSGRQRWPRLLPAVAVVAAAVLLLILTDWTVDIRPGREATAAPPRIAILYFANLDDPADSSRLGEIATNVLITGLSESRHLQVVSGQQLYDIFRLLGREGQKTVDRDIAREVGERAKADLILTGSILRAMPTFVLTAQLVERTTGDVMTGVRVDGDPGEDIFSVIARLAMKIRADLSLPQEGERESAQRAVPATKSTDAYRYYLDGIEWFNRFYFDRARDNFSRAVTYDTAFAMGYYYLSLLDDRALINKAVDYIERAGRKDAYYIRSRHQALRGDTLQATALLQRLSEEFPNEKQAFYRLGQLHEGSGKLETALHCYEQAREIDPMYEEAYNSLAYVNHRLGRYQDAIDAANTYVSLAPDQPNPYDTRGDIYAQNGRLDSAIASFKMALEREPEFYPSRQQLGHLYLYRQDYDRAEECYRHLAAAKNPFYRSRGRYFRALIPLAQGKFTKALIYLDEAILADSLAQSFPGETVDLAGKHFAKASIYVERGDYSNAIDEIERTIALVHDIRPGDDVSFKFYQGQLLAESGQIDAAEQLGRQLCAAGEERSSAFHSCQFVRGVVALARNDALTAVSELEMTVRENPDFYVRFMLARAYFEAGQYAKAIAAFEKEINTFDHGWGLCLSIWRVKMHYYLGMAYEKLGNKAKAMDQYRVFLNNWQNADEGISVIDDARERLTRMQASS